MASSRVGAYTDRGLPPPPPDRVWARPTDGLTVLHHTRARALPEVAVMRWGLNWTPELARRFINTNARAETLLGVPSFAPSMSPGYRCVVPLSAFFEWRTEHGQKVRYRVSRREGNPLLAAGLSSPDGRLGRLPVPSYTIVPRPANADLHELHDRMPALLLTADLFGWMNRRAPAYMAQEIALKSFPEGVLQYARA